MTRDERPQATSPATNGAMKNEDGSARMDFDLPGADNDALRALEPVVNVELGDGALAVEGQHRQAHHS